MKILGWGILSMLAIFLFLISAAKYLPNPSPAPSSSQSQAVNQPTRLDAPDLKIIRWSAGGSGIVAIVSFKLTNTSDKSWMSDIVIACDFRGSSGTVIDRKIDTVYRTLKPKESTTVIDMNLGFINSQAKSASCRALTAKACCNYVVAGST